MTKRSGGCAAAAGVLGFILATSAYAVGPTASTTRLTAPVGAPVVGQVQTFAATVTAAGSAPTGAVQFKDGTTTITSCPGALVSGVANCSYTFTTSGAHNFKAAYGGDSTYAISSDNKTENVVAAVDSTSVVTSATNPSAPGASVSLTATVTGASPGTGTPQGTVTFYDGATQIATGALNASGKLVKSVSFATNGAHPITVAYSGDNANSYAASTSAALPQYVKSNSATTLTSAPATAYTAQSVLLTATVTGVNPDGGGVTFQDTTTGTNWGPVTVAGGKATTTVTFSATGTHSLVANYAGNDSNNLSQSTPPVTETVQAKYTATPTVTSPGAPQIGRPATLNVTVTSSGSGIVPTGTVAFTDNGNGACTATLNPATGTGSCQWTFTSQAVHTVKGVYSGDTANNGNTSTGINKTVGISTTGMTLVPSANPSPAGMPLTLTATVDAYNETKPVKFTDNGVAMAGSPVTLTGNTASINVTPLAAAGHTYAASVVADTNNTAASTSLLVGIAPVTTTTSIATTTPLKGTTSTSFSFTAHVSGGAPTGSVTFRDGATFLGTRTISNGDVVTALATTLSIGQHAITAVYPGDNTSTAPSASTAIDVMVSATGTVDPLPPFTWNYGYDAEGNLKTVTDANANLTTNGYDSLSRTTSVVQPVPAAGASAPQIGVQYDLRDQVTQVTDPRLLPTTYQPDGLGNVGVQSSPDTGPTARTFYDNGLLHTSTDARNKTTTYTYDKLDRVSTIAYTSGTGTTFGYDDTTNGNFGIGHLTSMTDESGSTSWIYDGLGRVISRTQKVGPAAKSFTFATTYGTTGSAAGKVQTMTYPSGAVVTYGYDTAGRLNDVTVKGADNTVTKVLTGLGYTANGQPLSWLWGSGVLYQRGYDSYGRLVTYPLGSLAAGGVLRTVGYDAAGRIVGYSHGTTTPVTGWDQSFGYDGLDRLVNASTTGDHNYGYGYDPTGNRILSTIDAPTYSYTLTVASSSNWYTTVQAASGGGTQGYDLAGHLKSDANGANQFTYSDRGRLSQESRATGTFNYLYNALEQRVYKSGPSAVITTGLSYYVYDEGGHLVGEYDSTGKALYETVYVGDLPVAALTQPAIGQTTVSYIYADHLNTARVIVRPADHQFVWSWGSNEPFGQSAANANPAGLGAFTYNPRFPGQVADVESGWFYNWNRDYDPGKGRYVQSDPIGLSGGINEYLYAEAKPLNLVDNSGLSADDVFAIIQNFQATVGGMTQGGVRTSPGWFNDWKRSMFNSSAGEIGQPYLGCWEQAELLEDKLRRASYDDKWHFSLTGSNFPQPFGGDNPHWGPHYWITGNSSNPTDPKVILDPFNNTVSVVPVAPVSNGK